MGEAEVIQNSPYPLTEADLVEQFRRCGLADGQTVIVHMAMSKLGYVIGGAEVVIRALIQALGAEGTLLMPTQSWKNLDPVRGVHHPVPEAWWPAIREHWPAYDPATTPSSNMGAVAEMLRTWPGARRSAHPARSFAALGRRAAWLTEGHMLEDALGETSPLGKLYTADGMILLVGTDHASNTSLHLAEQRADYPGKRIIQESSAVLVDGVRQWVTYRSLEVHSDDFNQIGGAFEAAHNLIPDRIGLAETRLLDMRALVDWAVDWMEKHRGQTHGEEHGAV